MTIGFVQAGQNQEGGGGVSPVTLPGVVAGDSFVAIVHWFSTTVTLTNVTCTGEANLTAIGTEVVFSNTHLHMFRLDNVTTGGSKTIQANWSASLGGAGEIWVGEFNTTNIAAFLDQQNTATGASGNPTINLTTLFDHELAVAVTYSEGSDPTADTGYTLITLINVNVFDQGEYNVDIGLAGTKTIQMLASSANWAIKAATFRAAQGAAPTLMGQAIL